ncbi:MAG TPA: zinc-ribbon domain-containing protein, partial [Methylomirabilota bacterium]|nr:zinc-ribbon domain-containing protein [Methylomirabilota bacterium]
EFLQPLPRNIVGQSTTTIDLVKIMDEGKILLIKLDNLRFPSITSLIGSMMIALFLNAAASRTKKNLFNIYADEFQNFATEDFVTLIEEARKRHIGITIAHQNRGQLTSKNRQLEIDLKARTLSAKNKIVFQISGHDAEEVKDEFKAEVRSAGIEYKPEMRRVYNSYVIKVWEPPEKEREYKEAKERFDGLHDAILLLHRIIDIAVYTYTDTEKHLIWLNVEDLCAKITQGLTSYVYNAEKKENDPYPVRIEEWFDQWFLPDVYAFPCKLPIEKKLFENIGFFLSGPTRPFARPIIEGLETELLAKIEKLKKDAFTIPNRGYSYWHTTCIPALKNWYIATLTRLKQELIAQWKDITEIYKHYHDKLEKVDQGYFVPVYDYDLKVSKSISTHSTRWVTTGTQTSQGESEERTLRYQQVPGKPEPFNNAWDRIKNELTHLPNFTARVKILDVDGLTLVEHTIQTLDPNKQPVKPIFGHTLQARILRTQAKNRADGYVRDRMKIEDEITKRQAQYGQHGQSPPPPPPPPPQQPRGRGSVSCPACQAQNALGAKFCNQCGTKI